MFRRHKASAKNILERQHGGGGWGNQAVFRGTRAAVFESMLKVRLRWNKTTSGRPLLRRFEAQASPESGPEPSFGKVRLRSWLHLRNIGLNLIQFL